MDKALFGAGVFLILGGLTGLIYGAGINLQGMLARGASDYSFITAYIAEWTFVLIAGVALLVSGLQRK